MEKTAVLLMAYGTPNSIEEIEPYYTDIRGGRKPSPENLRELTERYQRIGGRTPLLDITRAQAHALQAALGADYAVYFGMKHWHPYLADTVDAMVRDGRRRGIAIALAPHYSRFSIDGYIQRVRQAIQALGANLAMTFVESWNDHPRFVESIAERMTAALGRFGGAGWNDVHVVFSAHSLPERILQSGDPYPRELDETCQLVAQRLGIGTWQFAYSSAGRTGDKWLGPDILETLDRIAEHGGRRVLVAPIGFVADHLEVLFDVDVECAERAQSRGLDLRRIDSPNASPTFITALAEIARAHDRT